MHQLQSFAALRFVYADDVVHKTSALGLGTRFDQPGQTVAAVAAITIDSIWCKSDCLLSAGLDLIAIYFEQHADATPLSCRI